MMSSITSSTIDRRPRAPVSFSMARSAIARSAAVGELQLGVLHREQRLVLLDQGVLRLGQDADQGVDVQRPQRRDDRQPADELGDHAELEEVVAGDLLQQVAQFHLVVAGALLAEADGPLAQPPADDVVQADERAAADEQDVAWCPSGCTAARDACGRPGAARWRRCLRASSAGPAARPRRTRRG